ncbi:MAG: hypothetical protein EU533_07475 [Promethearchaeota archaeon]|nr:MAG: hypothetical protein EU533_07475 [Candidatus Lokiarchaeota archaeon]
MNPTDRIIAVTEGRELDRVQTMSILTDLHPAHQVLGFPKTTDHDLFNNRFVKPLLNKWVQGWLGKLILKQDVKKAVILPLEASIELGFDAAWTVYAPSFSRFHDLHTIQDDWGHYNELIFDEWGNGSYMYREPAIHSPEEYDAWPYFPDPEKTAKETFKFYKKLLSKYGDKIAICGDCVSDMYDRIQLSVGFTKMAYYLRKKPDFIRSFISRMEEFSIKTAMAMMDAGIKIIFKGDDFCFKTGPQMNPKVFDEFWGPSYTRLCEAIHQRGGKFFLHSCGDNTQMFDYFIQWGIDGLHAFENTSTVDIYQEKKLHGDKVTIIGGVGVDYLLTKQSQSEEVIAKVKELIKNLAPGGRFLLAPVHSLPIVDMEKERIMIEAAYKYGTYPLN